VEAKEMFIVHTADLLPGLAAKWPANPVSRHVISHMITHWTNQLEES
jgi:hypothetical protein